MRPPSGSAAIALAACFSFTAGFSSDGCAENSAEAMAQLVETLSPKCGLIRLGNLLRPVLERLQKELRGAGRFLVRRILQQFGRLLLPRLFLFRCASKVKMAERLLSSNRTWLTNANCMSMACLNKPRYAEAILISPFFIFAHSKKHFLTIQYYTDADGQGKFALIHMDKGNARDIVAAAEAETGKKVERAEEK
jgi:hypothetical protein